MNTNMTTTTTNRDWFDTFETTYNRVVADNVAKENARHKAELEAKSKMMNRK